MKPATKEAYELLHYGSLALAEVEHNGMHVDMDKLDESIAECDSMAKEIMVELREDPLYRVWKKRFGKDTKITAPQQIGYILFEYLGLKGGKTATGGWSTKAEDLADIDHPFAQKYTRLLKVHKLKSTFLEGIKNELVGNILRGSISLNIARTYRSAASNPNLQNFPIREGESARIIRSVFTPRRKGRMIVEVDYKALEVSIAACYHKDPVMLEYVKDLSKDMHRDMAAEIFKLPADRVSKMARYCAKNMYVFPEFYGDYYINSARNIWEAMSKFDLRAGHEDDDEPMRKHLKRKGIDSLGACNPEEKPKQGTFEWHMKKVEEKFWNERFPIYKRWKQNWYNAYLKKGYFNTLTGFKIDSHCKKNDVINYPVQGSAFHCLLWSLMQLQKEIKQRGMKSLIICQIHDSILADVPEDELELYLKLAKSIMTERLRETWKWVIVPLFIEVEGSKKSWYDKKLIKVA